MNEQDLLQLKHSIEEAKSKASELKGQQQHLMKQLKTDWGCTTVEAAQKEVERLEKEIEAFNTKINKGIEELEDKYYTEGE